MQKSKIEKSSLQKCAKCGQLCCKYLTVKISAPRTVRDFDGLLWQMSHKDVKAYRDKKGWYLLIDNHCNHLGKNGKCAIYENRPSTCREYSIDCCEFGSSIRKISKKYFDNYDELNKYCRKKFKTWDKRF